jgi:hypothetical protein
MVRGNFIGAAIVAIIYTVYLLINPHAVKSKTVFIAALVILNALTIVLLSLAFK